MQQRLINQATENARCRICSCEIVAEIDAICLNQRIAGGTILAILDTGNSQTVGLVRRVARPKERLTTEKLIESRNGLRATDNLAFNSHVTSGTR